MTFNIKDHLPPELHQFEAEFSKLVKDCIKVSLHKDTPKHSWSSKVGGYPYWLTSSTEYPKGKNGKLLNFIAQINFAEIPELDGFPREGLVQFFIGTNDLYGLDFDAPTAQNDFRVVYHANIENDTTKLISDFSFIETPLYSPFSSSTSYGLDFKLAKEIISVTDFRFETQVMEGIFAPLEEDKYDLMEAMAEISISAGHKIGGYPHFTQEDPRSESHEVLLFQLDTDNEHGILWGDSGICNFFISADCLAQCDFSDVWYNWDCY
jgi:uncharacterized protein YwqG